MYWNTWGLRTLNDEIRSQDTHSGDTNTRFRRPVCGTETGEDDRRSAAHCTEEGL
jgi:hypothetical protein